jgi:hypothetical protein
MDNPVQQPNIPNQQGSLGQDPNFLRYLQGFLANKKNADKLQGYNISGIKATTGQTLVLDKNKIWQPGVPGGGINGSVTYIKSVDFTGKTVTTGTITFIGGVITAFT